MALILSTKHTEKCTSLLESSSSASSASSAIESSPLLVASSVKILMRTFVLLLLLLLILSLFDVEHVLASVLVRAFELLPSPAVSALVILSDPKVIFCPAELFYLCKQIMHCPWSFPCEVLSTWANLETINSCIYNDFIWDTYCLSLDVQESSKVLTK